MMAVHDANKLSLAANAPVQITLLETGEEPIAGRVVKQTAGDLQIVATTPIPCGATVRVEAGDTLLLGEIVNSGESNRITVEIAHCLRFLGQLEQLHRSLLAA